MRNIRDYEAMAMLSLPDDERGRIESRYNSLLAGFETLRQVETKGVEPLVSVLDITTVFREDIAKKLLTREEILSNAPEQYDGYFQVPGTLE